MAPGPSRPRRRLPVAASSPASAAPARKPQVRGWAAFTDDGTAPRWVTAARVVLVLAFAATIPTVLGLAHGNRLVWTVAIAALPLGWLTIGYHAWRRICPLAVAAQLGRLVGRPGTRKLGDWMGRYYLLVQLGLMIVALALRLVATNGSAVWLAGFLGAVVLAAMLTSFVYAGKTWCNFLCPVGMVEKIYTEPARGAAPSAMTSRCTPCVACKKHCPDIDLEQAYWKEARDRPRRIAYLAWPGVVIGFYVYFYLVAGDWTYYFSGAWAYERALPSHALAPGFTFAPMIPRIVAAPLTLVGGGLASYLALAAVEHLIVRARIARLPAAASIEAGARVAARVRHGTLAFAGLIGFNAFYCFAGQPSLAALPDWLVAGTSLVVVFASTVIFARRIGRREEQHVQERFAQKILEKWEWGDAPPSDNLGDIYLLHTERTRQREARLRAYKETIRELVADGLVTRNELQLLDSLRAQLGISDRDHHKLVGELSAEDRQLFDPAHQGSIEQRLAREAYRRELERLVTEAARLGAAPSAASLQALRRERGVSEDEEARERARLLAPGGPLAAMYDRALAEIARLTRAAELGATGPATDATSASLGLLRHLAKHRAHQHAIEALGVLAVMTQRADVAELRAQAAARGRVRLAALVLLDGVDAALRDPLVDALQHLDHPAPAAPASPAPPAALTASPLCALARDPSPYLRAVTAILLSRFDDAEARTALHDLLADAAPIVREAAVRALGARRRLPAELLARVLDDPDPSVRHAAVRAVTGEASTADPDAEPMPQPAQPMYATLDATAELAALTTIERMMLLRAVPMFAELDPGDLEELAALVEERRLEAGCEVVRAGEPGDAVYLVLHGAAVVVAGGDPARPARVVCELGPGACIGEMAVLDAAPRSATVRTTRPSRLLRVPADGFRRLLSERPDLADAIIAELVTRLRGVMARSAAGPDGDAPAPPSPVEP